MGVFDELKSAANILKEAGKIEQYQQILEVQEKLLEMQKKIAELEGENEKLKEKLKIKEELIYKDDAYWRIEGEKEDGPFCSRCWDKDKNLVRMHVRGFRPGCAECPGCKTMRRFND